MNRNTDSQTDTDIKLNFHHLKFFAYDWFRNCKLPKPQPNLNSSQPNLSFSWKWLYTTTPLPPTITTRNSMSAISQLLMAHILPNFKGRFLGPSLTDYKCHNDSCPGNICPGDICPYQEYLSCYWPDFDQTLKVGSLDYLEQISTIAVTFVQVTFVHIMNISAATDPILTLFQNQVS